MKKSKFYLLALVITLVTNYVKSQTTQTLIYPSVTICSGGSTNLDAGCGFTSYNWSNNSTTQTITVNSAGIYTVQVTDNNGFSFIKEFNVNITPPINLSISNAEICSGNQGTLDAGSNYSSYLWSTGATTSSITAGVGTYSLVVTDANGCTSTGTASVQLSTHCTTVPCGLVKNSLYAGAPSFGYTTAQAVSGAYGYKFNFYDVNNSNVIAAQKAQQSNYIYFAQVSGLFYNHQYYFTVQVEYQPGVYGPESKKSCLFTLNEASTVMNNCGTTKNNFYNTYTTCISVPQAVNYRFRFYDVNDPSAIIPPKTQTSNYLYFAQVPGLNYGHSYNITVEVEYPLENGGTTWGPPSSMSCVYNFGAAQTTVPCGNTYPYYTTAWPAGNAIQYCFTFYDMTTGNQVAQQIQTSNYIYFNQIQGLQPNVQYYWTVKVQYSDGTNILWGPESNPTCTVTYSPSARISSGSETNSPLKDIPTNSIKDESLNLLVYPNPNSTTNLNVSINSNTIDSQIIYKVYDLNGKLVLLLENGANEDVLDISNLESGTYMIKAITNGKETNKKFIKQ